jgi:pyruvate/2-oxoglutarate dehydrogenase complex dihydrolipoamide dehydrogenase (E3) component
MHVLVIGGGPAGVTAALHAVELGAEVTLVERGRIGGTALDNGPAPVRTLARQPRCTSPVDYVLSVHDGHGVGRGLRQSAASTSLSVDKAVRRRLTGVGRVAQDCRLGP